MLDGYINVLGGISSTDSASALDIIKAFLLECRLIITLIWIPVFFFGTWHGPEIILENWCKKINDDLFRNYLKLPITERTNGSPAFIKVREDQGKNRDVRNISLVISRSLHLMFAIPIELYIIDNLVGTSHPIFRTVLTALCIVITIAAWFTMMACYNWDFDEGGYNT